MVLPFLGQLFLDLCKQLTALCRLHRSNALHDLADEVDEGGVVSLPLYLNIVTNALNIELELGAFSQISELSQVLLKDALPDLTEDYSFLRGTITEICGVNFDRNNSLRLLELIVLAIPQVGDTRKLLYQLWAH